MPRTGRLLADDVCYHIVNRGNARHTVFHDLDDYRCFERLLVRACARVPMRLLSYCIMPNHFHLCVWPVLGTELSAWMRWLMTAHVRAHHARYETCGRIWQGRYKAFPVQSDSHLLTLIRYIERNPLRASLVSRAVDWPHSGIHAADWLSEWPVARPANWLEWVQEAQTPGEVEALRRCTLRGAPFGGERWVASMVKELGLESSLRAPHRPVSVSA